ncbi:hypothetical protein K0U83_21390, partial [bacterium]|nr:hypothetical protein [bacterium]
MTIDTIMLDDFHPDRVAIAGFRVRRVPPALNPLDLLPQISNPRLIAIPTTNGSDCGFFQRLPQPLDLG